VSNSLDGTLTKLRPSDGTNLGTFSLGDDVFRLASDGANVWAVDQRDQLVFKVRASDGVIRGRFKTDDTPYAIMFDGSHIWISNYYTYTLTELRPGDGTVLGTFPSGRSNPSDLAFDGSDVWVASGTSAVTRLSVDGSGAHKSYLITGLPTRLLFDGSAIWAACFNSADIAKISRSHRKSLLNQIPLV
jgi:outer membrane protein assembly factor BamB